MYILNENNPPTKEHKNSPQKQVFLKDLNSEKKKRNLAFTVLFKREIYHVLGLEESTL